MVTDEQYKQLQKQVDELEKKVNLLIRTTTETKMKTHKYELSSSTEELTPKKDITKYYFNNKLYSKRLLVLAVIKQYVMDNDSCTISTVNETFPDYLQGSLGVVKEISDAENYKGSKNRFFFGDDELLTLNDKKYAVCKEWTAKNINRFIKRATELGYDIQPIQR